ncbi:MAG: hypothetical protein E7230_01595 [Clostridiales bacterium]|nr:hypothetical protein [Clostridiales bacterium]
MIFAMKDFILPFLEMTAQRMTAPELFGAFHLIASALTAAAAVFAAILYAKRVSKADEPFEKLVKILSVTGWILVLLEIYKQFFLYYIVNGDAYDWWFFPFQLCSVPMYLCVLLPVMVPSSQRTFLTFMAGYSFISAAAALIYPADILRSYVALTLHGFIWHGLILFISLLILMTGRATVSARGLVRAAVLFAVFCVMALMINVVVEPVAHAIHAANPAVIHSYAAMFYLNPFHISSQPLVGSIQKTAGIPAGLLLYSLAVAAAGSIAAKLLNKRRV